MIIFISIIGVIIYLAITFVVGSRMLGDHYHDEPGDDFITLKNKSDHREGAAIAALFWPVTLLAWYIEGKITK